RVLFRSGIRAGGSAAEARDDGRGACAGRRSAANVRRGASEAGSAAYGPSGKRLGGGDTETDRRVRSRGRKRAAAFVGLPMGLQDVADDDQLSAVAAQNSKNHLELAVAVVRGGVGVRRSVSTRIGA